VVWNSRPESDERRDFVELVSESVSKLVGFGSWARVSGGLRHGDSLGSGRKNVGHWKTRKPLPSNGSGDVSVDSSVHM
jgi:hypothetical protein